MNNYLDIVKEVTPKKHKFKKLVLAFFSGGVVSLISNLIYVLLKLILNINDEVALISTGIIVVLIASLLTCMGIFDEIVKVFEAGLIIPTTGFAHSVSASSLDSKSEGLIIGIGGSVFKLAGSVIVSGVISSFLLTLLWVVIYG